MGLVVSIGLGAFDFARDEALRIDALAALVESGVTDCLREVLTNSEERPRVVEVRRGEAGVVRRFLSPDEARELLDALAATHEKYGSYAHFAWSELEEVGADDVQDLAVPSEDRSRRTVTLIDGVDVGVVSLQRSLRNWQNDDTDSCIAAEMFHHLAVAHRLVVHCFG